MKSVNTSTVSSPSLHCVHEDMQDCNVLAWCALTPEPQGRSLCRRSKSIGWSRSSTIQLPPLGPWAATCTCTHPRNQDQASLENAIVCITDFLSPVLCWQTPMLILLGTVSSTVMNMGMQPFCGMPPYHPSGSYQRWDWVAWWLWFWCFEAAVYWLL